MKSPAIRTIVSETADYFGLRRNDLLSFRRTRELIRPRQIVMYLARELTPSSLPKIGRHIGGRDHTTVLHGVNTIAELAAVDPAISGAIADLTERLGGHPDKARDVDPAELAIDVVCGARRATDLCVDEIEALARLVVGWGRSLGSIVLEGDVAEDDGEREPEPVAVRLAALEARIESTRRAYDAWAIGRSTSAEKGAFEALSKALLALFDAHSRQEA